LYILTQMLGYLYCQEHDSYCILAAADGVLLLGKGHSPSPDNLGTFSLKWLVFWCKFICILTVMLGNLLLGPQQLLYTCTADG